MIEQVAKDKHPQYVGICFGHQLAAQVLGGKVIRGDKGWELGIAEMDLTKEGEKDPIFHNVRRQFKTPTSHSEVVDALPPTAIELARNKYYPNQAFRLENLCGVQFHPEMLKEYIKILC